MSKQECVQHLVLPSSAELSCRAGSENVNPVGGAAATPQPTSSTVYASFCWEAGSHSVCLAFISVLAMACGRVPCVELAAVLSPRHSAPLLPISSTYYTPSKDSLQGLCGDRGQAGCSKGAFQS